MLRLATNRRLVPIAFLPFFTGPDSNDAVPEEKLTEITPTRVGIDKVKHFIYDEHGHTSKEVQSVINATTVGFITGFIMGGIAKSRFVTENFLTENQAAIFRNHYEAKKLLHYKVAVALFKGGVPFGAKLATFCFLFSGTSTALQTYKGKFDATNHIVAGAVAGSIYKLNMGLKGAIAGSILGTMLGAVSGTIVSLILYATGTEMGDLFEASNKWISARQNLVNEQMQQMNEEHVIFKQQYEQNQNIRKMVYEGGKQNDQK